MFEKVKKSIKHTSLYRRIRFTKAWFAIFSRKKHWVLKQEAEFYKKLFREHQINGLVFDIGSNLGFTTQAFLDAGAERVVAVEPDPQNFAVLKIKFGHNPSITIISTAISDYEGEANLWLHQSDGALHTIGPKWKEFLGSGKYHEKINVRTTTLDRLIEEYGTPKFVKIDVEGHELMVLQKLSYPIPLLSFEANLPLFREEAIKCIQKLETVMPNAYFNFSIGYRWEWQKWRKGTELINEILKPRQVCVEIFCKQPAL